MTNGTAEDNPPQWASTVWFAADVTECVVMFIINGATLRAFARNHHLRKRTTYLIINLTVADLLVGAVTHPMDLYYYPEYDATGSWKYISMTILYNIFPIASLTILSLIDLERLHATLCPFRHCLIDKSVYFKIVICSWLVSLSLSSVMVVLEVYEPDPYAYLYAWTSPNVLTLMILSISYVIITVNVKSNHPPHHFGAVASDRRLSVTLFIVTVASILTILPYAVYAVIPYGEWNCLSKTAQIHIRGAVYVLYYASSLVNPLIYAIRMKEFRNAVKDLICNRGPESGRVQPIELYT